eukprot:TRINITY_DN22802_c0_g1_i1.p1 TRINITY_DN22802_c0_g1~~TRINITY_DN22802_c0_g1_i1.p1  ORF type:complete len:650 (+),score=261.97 TRINITY_DN22802_c0_g1_i1:67-2016(+)
MAAIRPNRADMRAVADQCRWRGLVKCSLWLLEQTAGVTGEDGTTRMVWAESGGKTGAAAGLQREGGELSRYLLAKAAFDRREYLRCWNLLRQPQSAKAAFLHLYARYMAGETKKMAAVANREDPQNVQNPFLAELRGDAGFGRVPRQALDGDPYLLWLHGVVLRHAGEADAARDAFVRSIALQPLLWSSWQELVALGDIAPAVAALQTRGAASLWIVKFAQSKQHALRHQWDKALEALEPLGKALENAPAFLQHIASTRRHLRQWRKAKQVYEYLLDLQPYRFEGIVEYSNVLFITRRAHLANLCLLARKAFTVAKYRPETCMILADYHSAAERHERAYTYYGRALRLDPALCRDAHVLMGHEAIELTATGPAMAAYRNAVLSAEAARKLLPRDSPNEDLQKHCASAWYALGVGYELFRLPCLTLHHHIRAVQQPATHADQQPFWHGVASVLEEVGLVDEALRCHQRRVATPDLLLHLARLARKEGKLAASARYYSDYVDLSEARSPDACPEDAYHEALLVMALNTRIEAERQLQDGGWSDEVKDLLLEAQQACSTITMFGPSVETLSHVHTSPGQKHEEAAIAPQLVYDTAEELARVVGELLQKHCGMHVVGATPSARRVGSSCWAMEQGTPGGATRKLFDRVIEGRR